MNIFENELILPLYSIETSLHDKKLILLNVRRYEGPVTRQLLPYGGIQSLFDNKLIIYAKVGFIYVEEVIYGSRKMKVTELVKEVPNLINEVLL